MLGVSQWDTNRTELSSESTNESPTTAHGIIVPLLRNAEDARKLVKAAKFPPTGERGFGSPFPMEKFGGQTMIEYLQQANEALVTIAQIETRNALDNVFNFSFYLRIVTDEC